MGSHHRKRSLIPTLAKTVAVLDGSVTAPLTATETGSVANIDESTGPRRDLAADHDVSDPNFPLLLDLGPEPSLSEGLSRPKSRSVVDHLASVIYTASPWERLPSRWLWGLAALTTTVMTLVSLLARTNLFGTNASGYNGQLRFVPNDPEG